MSSSKKQGFFTRPGGFLDHRPAEVMQRRRVESRLLKSFAAFGYSPVETSSLDYSELYQRAAVGSTLYHKMITGRIADRNVFWRSGVTVGGADLPGRLSPSSSVILRADMTAPLCRMFVEDLIRGDGAARLPYRWSYAGQVFRDGDPQPDQVRLKEFRQIGVELLGSDDVYSDIEVIQVALAGARAVGIQSWEMRLGHAELFDAIVHQLGVSSQTERRDHIRQLERDELTGRVGQRIKQFRQPLTIDDFFAALEALPIENSDGAERVRKSSASLRTICKHAVDTSARDSFRIVASATRGLAYYTGLTFELHADTGTNRTDVCGGGRYRKLPKWVFEEAMRTEKLRKGHDVASLDRAPPSAISSKALTGVGLAFGLERVVCAISNQQVDSGDRVDVFVGFHHGNYAGDACRLGQQLRAEGYRVVSHMTAGEEDPSPHEIYGRAAHVDARWAIVIAPDEFAQNQVVVRDMDNRTQVAVSVGDLRAYLAGGES